MLVQPTGLPGPGWKGRRAGQTQKIPPFVGRVLGHISLYEEISWEEGETYGTGKSNIIKEIHDN